MGKGSQTTSTATSNAADPQASQAYRDILQRAQGVASTPYQAYSGPLTADVNSQQNLGIGGINSNANFASPYIQAASGQAAASSSPLTGQQIQQYLNPYTQNVVDTTNAQLTHDNGVQMAGLQGNQISQGALGGNATGVAKAILAGQQGRTMASTDAGLYQQGYGQAVNTAQQQQQLGLAGANAQANYGISGQGAALAGAGQQINAGTLQQQTEQQRLNALYGQYAQAQAFPYQQTQWLGGLATGVGSNLGGTSQGTTTGPAPNQTAQWVGAGLSAAALLSDRRAKDHIERIGRMNDGTPIYRFQYKDSNEWHVGPMAQDVERRNPDAVEKGLGGLRYVDLKAATDDSVRRAEGGGVGGTPWGSAQGWIPTIGVHGGSGAPQAHAPSAPQTPAFDASKFATGISGLKNSNLTDQIGQFFNPDAYGNGNAVYGGSSSAPLTGLSAADYGEGFARGGGVAGYAIGGGPQFDDLTNGDPSWEAPDVGAGYPRREARPRSDVINGDPAWERPDVGPGASASFGERFGSMPPAQKNPEFSDAYFAANGADPRAFAGANDVPMPRARPTGVGAPVVAADDDGDDTPPGIAGRSGAPPGTGVTAFAPTGPSSYEELPDAIRRPGDERAGLGLLPLSRNAGTGLLAAGLGMLASRSPNFGNAIGEGGLAGVSAYGSAEEQDRKVAAEAAKLSREARKQFVEDAMGNRKQTETERHNKVSEKNAQATADRTKFVPAGQYMGEDGIYRPVAMDQSTGRLVDMGSGKDIPSGAKIQGKGDNGFTDDDASKIARRYVASGDRTTMMGLGPAAKIKVQRMVDKEMDEKKISPEEMAQRTVEFEGRKAGSRTLGNMEAKMGAAAFEAEGAMKLARGVIERLPRTSFLPMNKLIEGYSRNTLNPDQAELYARVQAIVNTYSAVMSRGANVTTDSSRHHASELLNTAGDPATFNRVLDTMQNEIDMAKGSPARMQAYYRQHYGPKSVEEGQGSAGSPASSTQSPFQPPAGAIPRQFNGKTYYYDPATKQPYPGQ